MLVILGLGYFLGIDVTPLLLGAIAASDAGVIREYTAAVFEGYWVKQAAFKDSDELLAIVEGAGIPDARGILDASAGLEAWST